MFVFKLGFPELCVLCVAWLLYTFLCVCGTALTCEWDRCRRERTYTVPKPPTEDGIAA